MSILDLRAAFLIYAMVLALTGCSSAPVQLPTLTTDGKYTPQFDNVDTDVTALPNRYYELPLGLNVYELLERYDKLSEAKLGRNLIQNELLRRSDQLCSSYQARIINGVIVGNTAVKGVQATLGVVKSVSDSVESLAKLAGGFQGGITTALSGEVLQWKAFEDANRRITLARRNLRNVIRNAQRRPVNEYDVSQAVYDAERYHSYCNFAMALVVGDDWIGKEANEQIVTNPPHAKANTNAPDTAAAPATKTAAADTQKKK